MITIRPSSADVMNIVVAIIWPKRAPECIKMHHFEGEHAKILDPTPVGAFGASMRVPSALDRPDHISRPPP